MRLTRLLLLIALAGVPAACGPSTSSAPGPDRSSGSDARSITWTDGQPAYAITCRVPGGCQERALSMCNGKYTTLQSENMPMPGTIRSVQGQPSVIVRCG